MRNGIIQSNRHHLLLSFCIVVLSAVIGSSTCFADNLDIHVLHTMSNTMDHNEFLKMAVQHDSLTRSITRQQWYEELEVSCDDSLSMRTLPTLYDLLANEYYYRRLPNRDSVAQAWLAFHAKDSVSLPRLYVKIHTKHITSADSLLTIYEAEQDTWERGYVLSRITDYKNPVFYRYIINYLQRFPSSPFVPTIKQAKQHCEKIEFSYSVPQRIRTTDSITITYNNTNAHEIVFELYRLPDKWRKRMRKGSQLIKIDSIRVTNDGSIFQQTNLQCRLAPQTYGYYFIYARFPEDSLQKPVDSLKSLSKGIDFFVSDLRVFNLCEDKLGSIRPWYVIADAHTGQPIEGVRVKYYNWDIECEGITRYSNGNGEIVYGTRGDYDYEYYLYKGADKYHHFGDGDGPFYDKVEANVSILPNATIFRPGDTLKISIVGHKRYKYQAALFEKSSVYVSVMRNSKEHIKDTVIAMDDYASVSLSVPLTDDMRRGNYFIRARLVGPKKSRLDASTSCTVRLEDYRLPTFNLSFENSCCKMNRDKLSPIVGKAFRTNGMPMIGAVVSAKVVFWHPKKTICVLDTVMTDSEGRFSFSLTEEAKRHIKDNNSMSVTASLIAPDGEKRDADISISFSSGESSDNKPLLIAGVSQDSLLWIPSDSATINGREVTMRVGVPRLSWVYCVVSNRDKILSHTWQQLAPGMHSYSFTLPDRPDDYLDIHFVTTDSMGKHVERYRHLQGVSPTELHIIPVTMRDYLTPDAYESWTFRLTDAKGKPVMGRMMLSMTDNALELLNSSVWDHPLMEQWNEPYTRVSTPYYPRQEQYYTTPFSQRQQSIAPPLLFEPYRNYSGSLSIASGKVVDAHGEPLIGVSILEQGGKNGTISDYDGNFVLPLEQSSNVVVSFIGMKTIVCAATSNMYIVMQENTEVMNEVVVLGYGSSKKHIGTVAGVQSSIRVRGTGSLSANSIPIVEEAETLGVVEESDSEGETSSSSNPAQSTILRQGDTRLSLYLPSLRTDSAGEIHVRFLAPSDNTEWLVQAMAWTKECTSDYIGRTLTARRTLMLRLQLPRFMRHGDALKLPCVISNTADTAKQASVIVRILDAATDSLLTTYTSSVRLTPASSQTLFFPYTADHNTDIVVQAEVKDNSGMSDGEKRLLRILPIDEPVKESVPFFIHASDTAQTLRLATPAAAENRKVELMLCNDPIAYVAAQLPAEIDSSAITVTQLAHNLYTLSLRNRLAKNYPSLVEPVKLSSLISKLQDYQRVNGAFSWLKYSGSFASYYLTLRVLDLLGDLQHAGALDNQLKYTKRRAVGYIDREIVRDEAAYRKKHHDSLPDYNSTHYAQYAYIRVMFDEPQDEDVHRIVSATLDSLYDHLNTKELTAWPLLALTFERAGQHERALSLINGLRRYAMIDDAHGMYWNNLPNRWWWYQQAEVQASFLMAFSIIDPRPAELEAMHQWLILNNRTTNWGESSLNAYATYALMHDSVYATASSVDSATLQYISLPDSTTCYTLHHTVGKPAWGALMTSYNAPVDQLKPFASPAMKIERRFDCVDKSVDSQTSLSKGDRVRVTITLTTDREMDNVVVTDRRPAILEPMGLSSFNWLSNTLYYCEIRNADQIFYVEHLCCGTTVLSYDCYVTASGTTLAGLASAVCDIAPEFTTHTASAVLEALW